MVVALALVGVALFAGAMRRNRLALWGVVAAGILCLADWILIEDFGFFGGVGTDPNSMLPMLCVIVTGYVALVLPATATVARPTPAATEASGLAGQQVAPQPAAGQANERWWDRVVGAPAAVGRSLVAIGAIVVIVLGAAPMALASTNPVADPILNTAMVGSVVVQSNPAPPSTSSARAASRSPSRHCAGRRWR